MLFRQRVAQFVRGGVRATLSVVFAAALPTLGVASNHLVITGGYPQPMGDTESFSSAGGSFDVRWRHYNRGRTAYEFSVGYLDNALGGVIIDTIDEFEQLVRDKNTLAQTEKGQPGRGTIVAEYGTLSIYNVNVNVIYRVSRRARLSPLVSVGGGLYNWRVPFRIRFFDVPSFGEDRAYDPPESSTHRFTFDDRLRESERLQCCVIDYTKHETTGGLNAAVGADLRLMRSVSFTFEGRAHLIFSSGQGNPQLGIDNQDYLSPMYLLLLHGGVSYRF